METLKEKFEALSRQVRASGKPAAAWFPQFTPAQLLNAEQRQLVGSTCCM